MCGAIYSRSCVWLHMSPEWNPTGKVWHHCHYFCLFASSPVIGQSGIQIGDCTRWNSKTWPRVSAEFTVISRALEAFTHLYTEDAALAGGLGFSRFLNDRLTWKPQGVETEPLTFIRRTAPPDPLPPEQCMPPVGLKVDKWLKLGEKKIKFRFEKWQTSSCCSAAFTGRFLVAVEGGGPHTPLLTPPTLLPARWALQQEAGCQIRLQERDIGELGQWSTLQSWGKSTHMKTTPSSLFTRTVHEHTVSCISANKTH